MKIVVIGGSGLIGDNPRIGPTRFEDWLRRSIPRA